MHRRDTYEPIPERDPYFRVDTPIGPLVFARRLPSLTRSWGLELQRTQEKAQRLLREAHACEVEDEAMATAATATALLDASIGLYIARHWIDERYVLEARQAWRAGKLHPSEVWDDSLPDLASGSLRYGWLTACELSEWDLTQEHLIELVTAIAHGHGTVGLPDAEDVEDAAVFCDPPMASGISA